MAAKRSRDSWTYDVFLSFRGEDTRKNFTDHLYFALKSTGINTFRDDNELRRGEDITAELLKAIQGSRISVIVFSKKYADSRWCLEELVKIMECRRTVRQLVLPIFYDVDPSDVRKQTGSFEEAFIRHEERFLMDKERVMRWRLNLTEAANLSGWDLRNTADGHEARFVRKIVQEITRELNSTYLFVALYPVGMEDRVENIVSLLKIGREDDVRIVGIWGMGGMGKTTIAKAVYNKICHIFEGKSFLANIREISNQTNGQVTLQQQLLSDILTTKKMKLGSVDRGINVIKERLCNKRVLIILDDIDQLGQLNALARSREWFGSGSRIIITTRDEHLLKQIEVDEVYKLEEMNNIDSLELFSWHAFQNCYPTEEYFEFSRTVVTLSGRLPLALEVLGSFLFGRSFEEWKDAVEKLKRIPNDEVQRKLRISFDGLNDENMKDIFLDICCFFVGMEKEIVKKILAGCGFFAEIGVSVLLQRCLVRIGDENKLMMHDLVRDMGRDIVREKFAKELGRISRLWFEDDAIDVLTKLKGTIAVEGIALNLQNNSKEKKFTTKAFAEMQSLRLLQLNYVQLSGSFGHLSRELRWLCWHGFPLKFIPNDFYMGNLVAIDMRYSNLKQLWKDPKFLEKLKILNLSHSHQLTTTPNFLKLPNLEKLILKDCKSLIDIHQSIGYLKKLVYMNLRDCKSINNFPTSFLKLKSVETLILSGCSKIDNLPEDMGEMESLTTLLADKTGIRKLPISIVRLKNLKYLSLFGCKGGSSESTSSFSSFLWSWISPKESLNSILMPPSLQGLNSLKTLCLADCNLSTSAIPSDLGTLHCLEELDLRGNSFHCLPSTISCLSKLESLRLDNCKELRLIPDLPSNLTSLYAANCPALERISSLSGMSNLIVLTLSNCQNLVEVHGLDKLSRSIRAIHLEGCSMMSNTLKNILQEWSVNVFGGMCVPGDEIPEWFPYKEEGNSVFLDVPQLPGYSIEGLVMAVIFTYHLDDNDESSENDHMITVFNYTKGIYHYIKPVIENNVNSIEDHIWLGHMPNFVYKIKVGDVIEVRADFGSNFSVKQTGAVVILKNLADGKMLEIAKYMQYCSTEDGIIYVDIEEDETV